MPDQDELDFSPPCEFCGRPSSLLCDYGLGWKLGEYIIDRTDLPKWEQSRRATISDDLERYTCDLPLCEECSSRKGMTFFCGKMGGVETIDHCPIHADKHDGDPLSVLSPEKLTDKRRELRMAASKHRMLAPRGSCVIIPSSSHLHEG